MHSSRDRLTPLSRLPLMERVEVAHGGLHLEVGDDVAKSETSVRRAFGIQRPLDVAMSQKMERILSFGRPLTCLFEQEMRRSLVRARSVNRRVWVVSSVGLAGSHV